MTTPGRKPRWLGPTPTRCDMCSRLLAPPKGTPETFYDVAVPTMRNVWGCLCQDCFTANGCSTGTGKGQKYEWHDGHYVKTEG